jgi:hypothetical protein
MKTQSRIHQRQEVSESPTRRDNRQQDRQDLVDLRAAITRNADKPGTPWEIAKKELEIQ